MRYCPSFTGSTLFFVVLKIYQLFFFLTVRRTQTRTPARASRAAAAAAGRVWFDVQRCGCLQPGQPQQRCPHTHCRGPGHSPREPGQGHRHLLPTFRQQEATGGPLQIFQHKSEQLPVMVQTVRPKTWCWAVPCPALQRKPLGRYCCICPKFFHVHKT